MRGVLTIAVLLRFMDSFLIYAEPFVLTGGGPGNSTTFLFIYLVKVAVGQFDVGPAAAFSIVYFLIVLVFCCVLSGGAEGRHERSDEYPEANRRAHHLSRPVAAADLLDAQYVVAHQRRHLGPVLVVSDQPHLRQLHPDLYG
jgi:hypothetical protein